MASETSLVSSTLMSNELFVPLALLGVASHAFFVRYHEVDRLVGRWFLPYIFMQIGLWIWLSITNGDFYASGIYLWLANASFFAPLIGSISVYRLFFHPLRSFPGPGLARLTTGWGVSKIARGANKYQLHHELHRQYGDIVRIAPNFLSINRVDGLLAIYGAGTKCGKSQTFYSLKDDRSLQTETDLRKHGHRRPPWEKALSPKRTVEYLPLVYRLSDMLVKCIIEDGSQNNSIVTINRWLSCFVFDMMGELAYSKSYGCLETGIVHRGIVDMETAITVANIVSALPWFVRIITSIVGVPRHMKGFVDLASSALAERKAAKVETPDVLSYVFNGKVALTPAEEIEDTMLIQIGGSDTTNSTLTFCLYRLATNAEIQTALRHEILSSNEDSTSLAWEVLRELPLLEAVINETLRMHPAVPGGMPRLTPKEGLYLESIYIPGGTTVSCPTWTIQMDPENFSDPSVWMPHRWITPPARHNLKAFVPFSAGPFGCVGRTFAYMEMKIAVAKLVVSFELRLAPGEDGAKLLRNSKDHTAMVCAPLRLAMRPICDH